MDHSAHPRVESVATYVLTVSEREVPITECLNFDTYVAEPTYTIIGTGSNGTVVLSDDALVSTEDDTYCVALLVGVCEWDDDLTGTANLSAVTDDAAGTVPEYLKLDGSNCFGASWRIRQMDGKASITADNLANNHTHQGDNVRARAMMAYKHNNYPMPAGTTITYTAGATPSEAVVVLVKNAAPYTSTPKSGSATVGSPTSEIADFFSEGGVVFVATWGYNGVDSDCGPLTGERNTGVLTTAGGDLLMQLTKAEVGDTYFTGIYPACSSFDNDMTVDIRWYIQTVAAGGGNYDYGASLSAGGGQADAWGWPAQGYF